MTFNVCIGIDWRRRTLCLRDRNGSKVRFRLAKDGFSVEGEDMKAILKDTEKVGAEIVIVDAKGNPAVVDGTPLWEPSGALLSVTPSADGLSAEIAALGPLGIGQVTVRADADTGEGIKELIGVLDVEVISSEATAIDFKLSTPEPA